MYHVNDIETVVITLECGVPTYLGKEVILTPLLSTLLAGKGNGGKIQIFKRDLKYK